MKHHPEQHAIDVQGGEEWDIVGFISHLLTEMNVLSTEISVSFISTTEMRVLNYKYRKKDEATDVLSFPQSPPKILGDIVLNKEIIATNAKEHQVSMTQELKRCIIHGILHLSGMTHREGWNSPMLSYQETLVQSVDHYPLENI